jgi:uncharacterized protein (TIGR02996 family)
MTEDQRFLQAIIRDPDDDGLRLMYSDWLEEHGDPARAEFIRTSIALTQFPPAAPERSALAERLKQMEEEHGKAWCKPLRMNQLGLHPRFERGLVERLQCDYEQELFYRNYKHWFRSTPLRHLTLGPGLENDEDGLARFAEIPELSRLRTLNLWGHQGMAADEWAKLFSSLFLEELDTLSVSTCTLDDPHVFALARSTSLTKLRVLDLTYNGVGVAGAMALVESPFLRSLRVIYIGDNGPFAADDPLEVIRILELRFEVRQFPED